MYGPDPTGQVKPRCAELVRTCMEEVRRVNVAMVGVNLAQGT